MGWQSALGCDLSQLLPEAPFTGFQSRAFRSTASGRSASTTKGFFEKNELGRYSLNNLTATPDPTGAVTVQFGGCTPQTTNCLPIVPGWNYTVRLYRPRQEILNGSWQFPEAQPAL
jgi:hypothetical protein